jgi:lipoprotein
MKKNLFFLLLMGLTFASCSKDVPQNEPKILPAGSTLALDLAGDILSEAPSGEEKALDFYVANNKVQATLKGKTKAKVKTYLYSNGNLVWSADADWKVINNGAGLRYEGEITTSAPLQVGQVKLIAILANDNSPLSAPTASTAYSVKAIATGNDNTTSIDVPYAMQSDITIKDDGNISNVKSAATNKVFKPYGNILRFRMQNTTNGEVKVKYLSINLPSTSYTLKPDELSQGPKRESSYSPLSMRDIPLQDPVVIPANSTSDKNLIVWVGELTQAPRVTLICEGPTLVGYYAVYQPQKTSYTPGKQYTALLKIRDIKNPLWYFDSTTERGPYTELQVRQYTPPTGYTFVEKTQYNILWGSELTHFTPKKKSFMDAYGRRSDIRFAPGFYIIGAPFSGGVRVGNADQNHLLKENMGSIWPESQPDWDAKTRYTGYSMVYFYNAGAMTSPPKEQRPRAAFMYSWDPGPVRIDRQNYAIMTVTCKLLPPMNASNIQGIEDLADNTKMRWSGPNVETRKFYTERYNNGGTITFQDRYPVISYDGQLLDLKTGRENYIVLYKTDL